MAVHNTAGFLRDALESVSNQTFRDFELLVVDDGSDDGSEELLQEYAARDSRVRLVTRGREGLVATRNELLGNANGDLIAWMDSDDVSLPDRIALQVDVFKSDAALVCLGGAAQCVDPDGHPLNVERYPASHAEILAAQLKGGAMRFPTTMMRRNAALAVGGFRAPFKMGEDFDFLLRLSEIGKMGNVPDIIYLYRQHLESVCKQLGPNWLAYRDQVLELAWERRTHGKDRLQLGGNVFLPTSVTLPTKQLTGQTYCEWAGYAAQNGDRELARRYAKASVEAWPWSWVGWKTMFRLALGLRIPS